MKRILFFLILIGPLGFCSIGIAEEGKWTRKSNMPTARSAFSTSVVDGKIYAIGGFFKDGGDLSTVEEYNSATDKWTRKADMPTARRLFSASEVNGKIYAIGGVKGETKLSTVEEYNPKTDTWTRKADMPTPRSSLSTSVVNRKIYAIGGIGVILKGDSLLLTVVEEYDPATDTWTKKADMPTRRFRLSSSPVNGKIYAIGGWGGNGPSVALTTVEEYDPATDKWTKKADMPTKRFALSTSAVNGKIYVIGGGNQSGYVSSTEEYDPATDTWTKKADMPTKRFALSTSAVNGKIYAIGGYIGPIDSTSIVEEFDPGLSDLDIEAKGKFVTSWGKIKSKY